METLMLNGHITVFGGQKDTILSQLNALEVDYNYSQVLKGVWEINLK